MKLEPAYPTPEHQKAAEAITDYFVSNFSIDGVLLVNSCARGKATRDSCLDIVMLAKPDESRSSLKELEAGWEQFESSSEVVKNLYVEILDLPELYEQLTHLFEIRKFESHEIAEKAKESKHCWRNMLLHRVGNDSASVWTQRWHAIVFRNPSTKEVLI